MVPSAAGAARAPSTAFAPGHIIAGRYRIVALLGCGAMGEVYRAEDLRLGQAVALKFLPASLANDGGALARFHREAAIARQISHPNVCRVFDIGDADGRLFLTMEYVDGEDLASLLRRIGRISPDKALDLARQLCTGLAAAHGYGIVHRDLKPTNIMVDGRGRVRITDFGLAVVADQAGGEPWAGTPAYMSPEQLAGEAATQKSDLYALGLVLFELYSGKPAFTATTLDGWREAHTRRPPSRLTPVGVDEAVDKVVLWCLEKSPKARPPSALAIAAALPGGDLLAAAVAAGETPSPEMVAAATTGRAISITTAAAVAAMALVLLFGVLALSRFSNAVGLAGLPKAPDVLVDRAQEIVRAAGYTTLPADSTWYFMSSSYLPYRNAREPSTKWRRELRDAELVPGRFYYRQSPVPMEPLNQMATVWADDPAEHFPGMLHVQLDARGRLTEFRVSPRPGGSEAVIPGPEPDWTPLLKASWLKVDEMKPETPRAVPDVPFDFVRAWTTTYGGEPMHVVAASLRGNPVWFYVYPPWVPKAEDSLFRSFPQKLGNYSFVAVAFGLLIAGFLVARRNFLSGRGDRKGAARLAQYFFCIGMLGWALTAHHRVGAEQIWNVYSGGIAVALFGTAYVWVSYLALEPLVRREWPHLLIAWTRLLSGRYFDPLVGRDVLIGVVIGVFASLLAHLEYAIPSWINLSAPLPWSYSSMVLRGARELVSHLLGFHMNAITWGLASMFYLSIAHVITRRRWASALATLAFFLLANIAVENSAVQLPMLALRGVLFVFGLMRWGVLTFAVAFFVAKLLTNFPLSVESADWYFGRSCLVLAVCALILAWALRAITRPSLQANSR